MLCNIWEVENFKDNTVIGIGVLLFEITPQNCLF